MKLMAAMIKNSKEKLPLEYPMMEILKIYGRRLYILLIIIVANLILLGIILFISSRPESTGTQTPSIKPPVNVSIIFIVFILLSTTYVFRNSIKKQKYLKTYILIFFFMGFAILLTLKLSTVILTTPTLEYEATRWNLILIVFGIVLGILILIKPNLFRKMK